MNEECNAFGANADGLRPLRYFAFRYASCLLRSLTLAPLRETGNPEMAAWLGFVFIKT